MLNSLLLQCASVSRAARMHGRKFKVADEVESNQLFDEPYRPEDSRHFDVAQSSTFIPQASQTFDLNYADGSHLRGFSGVDQVQSARFSAAVEGGESLREGGRGEGARGWLGGEG